MGCLCCGGTVQIGGLCRACAHDVSPCEGLIPDHVRSTVDTTLADAWVVDGFGVAHAVVETTAIGRSHDGQLIVLASSVSREHAELHRAGGAWQLRDLGSRNGSFVDGARVQGRSPLPGRAVIKIGDVALWFLAEVVHEPVTAVSVATASIASGLVRYQLAAGRGELFVIGTAEPGTGGALLAREEGAAAWTERRLAPLEFQLLRVLCARALEEVDSPAAVRGCVPTRQLARDLPFQSKYANEENVRQVVRRLRAVLAELAADSVLAVAPGRGYYLACGVSASADRRS